MFRNPPLITNQTLMLNPIIMKRKSLYLLSLAAVITAHGQTTTIIGTGPTPVLEPRYFAAIFAGLVLAVGIQFILSALSVAIGISAVGDVRQKYVDSKYDIDSDYEDDDSGDHDHFPITSALGVWNLVTVSVSLFLATALAIHLAVVVSIVGSIAIGLTIWALFFILMFYLETLVANTILSSLINIATSGVRASASAIKGAFSSSKEQKIRDFADDSIVQLRETMQPVVSADVVNGAVDRFFERAEDVAPSFPDYEKVKSDLEDILDDHHEQQRTHEDAMSKGRSGPAKMMAVSHAIDTVTKRSSAKDAESASKIEKLKSLRKELQARINSADSNEEKLRNVVASLSNQDEEKIQKYIDSIKSKIVEFDPKQDDSMEGFASGIHVPDDITPNHHPETQSRLAQLDRAQIVEMLDKNTKIDREKIDSYADSIEASIAKVTSSFKTDENGDRAIQLKAEKLLEAFMGRAQEISSKVKKDDLVAYFQGHFANAKDSGSSLKKKLKGMDVETVRSFVVAHTAVTDEHIDNVVASVIDAKDKTLSQIEEIEQEYVRRKENLKRKAVIKAENARKASAQAAWWLVGTAAISAASAALAAFVFAPF